MDILSKLNDRKREPTEKQYIEMHHDFCACYGWIPIEEFKSIPLPTLFNLNTYVQQEKKMKYENNQLLKIIAKCLGAKIRDK